MAGEIKHSWNGTVLTITSDSGTSSADLKGEKGDRGIRGAQGVRGLCGLSADGVTDADNFEAKADKVLEITEESTHDNYPSAKAVVDYVKGTKDKWVDFAQFDEAVYFYTLNDNGSWSANSDIYNLPNMQMGETYKFISELATIEITLDNWDGSWFKAYSDDGKCELWITGVYIANEEDAEYFGEPIGTFYGGQAYFYYDSAIGELINGVPIEEIEWDEWGYYAYYGYITAEYLEAQKISYRYLPEDIATKDMIPDIPEDIESTKYKIQSINDMNDEADKQYPSASLFLNELIKFEENAIEYANSTFGGLFDDIFTLRGQTNFDLVAVGELTEDVVQITPSMSGQYKELYWAFEIPTINADNTSTEKARLYLFDNIPTKITDKKILQQGAAYINNFTKAWNLCISIKLVGKYAWNELWYFSNDDRENAYGKVPNANLQNGIVFPNKLLTKDYIDTLTIWMASENSGRYFPVGTKYELWGVRR